MSGRVKRCRLDGRQRTPAAIYDRLARDLDLPPHFGRNLDALWDVLTTEVEGPVQIVWRLDPRLRAELGPFAEALLTLFTEVAHEREDFTFTLITDP